MKYLLVVDLQREFVKDRKGEEVYKACLDYINMHRDEYGAVLAAVYVNEEAGNMQRLVGWNECKKVRSLEFVPNAAYYHSGYSIQKYPAVTPYDTIDIIGFDTDACVLNAAFDVFNLKCNMRILTKHCWSSGGKKMHQAGLAIMERQFGKAVIK